MRLKSKRLSTIRLNWLIKQIKSQNWIKKQKELKLTALPKWLRSKNDFNEATKLIDY